MMVATGQCNANDGTVVMWRRLKTMLTIHLLNWGGLCSRGPVGIDHQAPISPFLPIAHSFLPIAHSFLPVAHSFLPMAARSLSVAPPFLLLLPQSHVSLSPDPHFFPHTFIWACCQINFAQKQNTCICSVDSTYIHLLLHIHLFWLDQGTGHIRPPPHPPAGPSSRREGLFVCCSCYSSVSCWQRQEFPAVGPAREEDHGASQVNFPPAKMSDNLYSRSLSRMRSCVCADKKADSGKQPVIQHLPNTPDHFRILICTNFHCLGS